MGDYIILGIAVIIISAVIIYIVKKKKSGAKCIGCPYCSKCSSCNCSCLKDNKPN